MELLASPFRRKYNPQTTYQWRWNNDANPEGLQVLGTRGLQPSHYFKMNIYITWKIIKI
jgi:hypothetical protein